MFFFILQFCFLNKKKSFKQEKRYRSQTKRIVFSALYQQKKRQSVDTKQTLLPLLILIFLFLRFFFSFLKIFLVNNKL